MREYSNRYFSVEKKVFNSEDYFMIDESDYVCCLVRCNEGVVIIREFKAAYEQVVPNLITGGISKGEPVEQAAWREIEEETTLSRLELREVSMRGPLIISPNRRFAKVYLYEFEYIGIQLADLPHNVRLETGPSVVDWYRKRSLPLPWYIACYGDFSLDFG